LVWFKEWVGRYQELLEEESELKRMATQKPRAIQRTIKEWQKPYRLLILFLAIFLLTASCSSEEQAVASPTRVVPVGTAVEAAPTGTTERKPTPAAKITDTSATASIIDNSGDKVQAQDPEERSSEFKATDLKGRNIFELDFNEFPFSCNELSGNELTSTFFPTDLITFIEPMGRTSPFNGHVTPTDHLYVHREYSAGNEYILAPGDGYIVKVERAREDSPLSIADEQGRFRGEQAKPLVPDYRVVMMHSCTLFTIFIHLGELAPAVSEAWGSVPRGETWMAGYDREPVPLRAGDPIARYGSQGLDWSVHDANTVLEGFVAPARYEDERFKIHTVDPFQFYREPARAALLDKMLRKTEPRAGKIGYDIEGRIIGNWFLEDTNDFLDARTQLSIVYGYIDPTQLRISIGADMGIDDSLCGPCFGSYGVRGNGPDPANVGVGAGLVKYELMSRDEEGAWVSERVGDTSLGAFLVQHLGDRRIRVEVIPGKSPEEVSGFSDKARTYRR
jgi:hypothetical protein